jgi:hypothetical protein
MQAGDLRGVASLFGTAPEARLALIRAVWPQVVGEQVAGRAEVASLTGGLLRLRVADPRWRKVLPRMRKDILARLHQVIGALAPQQIGLIEGRLSHDADGAPKRHRIPARSPDAEQPVPAALASAAQSIADATLRSEFLAAAARYLDAAVRRNRDAPDACA